MDNMDETHASMKSTTDAGATRKRRSSILKSQRPPRTPLSELELHVATPTDTAKSRRVSFSRRTGVAEFVTNEATTTWKNFYEEHNKSLEVSGHEALANAPRQMSIGHIGMRIFDQQFEEVEIVDVGGTLQSKTLVQDFHTSLNNLNITQQLASIECPSDDQKLTVAFQNFELSSFTDHQSKLFGDELSIPAMTEMSNPISIDFSIPPINKPSTKHNCDDLDEIVKDLEKSQSANVVCRGPFSGDNMSEYIEVDLNMTHVPIKSDDCEMSITDTVRNPEVQEVSKSISSIHNDRKFNDENDWIMDKENIAINPYVTPKESKNFAINESSDKILVFDGKKLTVKSEKEITPHFDKKENFRSTLLPDLPTGTTPKRKTIVLNTNDDLPNFMSESPPIVRKEIENSTEVLKQSVIYNDCDLSMTQAMSNKIEVPKRKTIIFEDDMGNLSVTKAVAAQVIINKQEKRKTIIFENDNANISVTQAVPAQIIAANNVGEKRKTIVYENDISFTQALPSNFIFNSTKILQHKTLLCEKEDMSVSHVIPENAINKSNNNLSNISITQAIPSNIIVTDINSTNSAKSVIFDGPEDIDIEITRVVPDNVVLFVDERSEKQKTIVFEDNIADISVTQAVPANILLEKADVKYDTGELEHEENIPLNNASTNPIQIIKNDQDNNSLTTCNRRKTIIYNEEEAGDISMTQVIPSNIVTSISVPKAPESEQMEITGCNDIIDISITCKMPTNILIQNSGNLTHESKLLRNIENSNRNLITSENKDISVQMEGENRSQHQSDLYNKSVGNLSITQPIPSSIGIKEEIYKDIKTCEEKSLHKSHTEHLLHDNLPVKQEVLVYQTVDQNFSQSKYQRNIEYSSSESEKHTEVSNESVISKEMVIDNCYNKDNESIDNKCISNNNSITNSIVMNQSILKCDNQQTSQSSLNINQIGNIEKKYIKEHKQNKENECLSKNIATTEYISDGYDDNLKVKKSFLNDLLDMSNASLPLVDKSDVRTSDSRVFVQKSKIEDFVSNDVGKSNESFIVMTIDNERIKSDHNVSDKLQTNFTSEFKQEDTKHLPALECIEKSEDVQRSEIVDLLNNSQSKRLPNNRHYERVVSADTYDDEETSNQSKIKEKSIRKSKKSFKNADDTKELLDMLSDFTEGDTDNLETNKSTTATEPRQNLLIENNHEPQHLGIVHQRRSIVLSREDLLNNISMAQAALQQSRFEIDENETVEETRSLLEETIETDRSRKKTVRISNEVVKTLQFEEDDSVCDASLKPSLNLSPLKKPAFGETSYTMENKAKVIPSYLKDVSDNLKALMSDLVKPTADVMPFESVDLDKSLKKSPSTCSTQMQANLITSSQIDFDVELHSNLGSLEDVKIFKTNRASLEALVEKPIFDTKLGSAVTQSFQSVTISAPMDVDHSPMLQTSLKRPIPQSPERNHLKVFDHGNPLNNILLAPIDDVKVHKYNPIGATETQISHNDTNITVERLTTHYNVESALGLEQPMPQFGNSCVEKMKDSISLNLSVGKPLSIDCSTDGLSTEVKSTEANTLIAMKGNNELLEDNSSLTLVDDTLESSDLDIELESKISKEAHSRVSPLRAIYKMDTDGELLQKIGSDVISVSVYSNYETVEDNLNTRKRSYSPTRKNDVNMSQIEVTPKPLQKMQKVSNSPQVHKRVDNAHDEFNLCSTEVEPLPDVTEKSSSNKSPNNKCLRNETLIVQHVNTEYNIETLKETDKGSIEDNPPNNFPDDVMSIDSFTSSNHGRKMEDVCSVPSNNQSINSSRNASSASGTNQFDDNANSNNLGECSSSFDVVDKINMLKFMGSSDCEWESSGGDAWMFRFLRSHIRLTTRLSQRRHAAARSRVRADTPLEAVTVDVVREELKDPLAALCVRFAADAMRRECVGGAGGGCVRAADVPALLRRCARAARAARRWARAMRDAQCHMAYTVTHDGDVTLKVANVALSSVWEVRLRLEMMEGGAWPCAGGVRARSELAGAVAERAARAPRDWRHAPTAMWAVFRYLKNKTRDDEKYLGL